jgi:hypothetical protein
MGKMKGFGCWDEVRRWGKLLGWEMRVRGSESVFVLIHTCKRELSPAHLVCPRRHNA